MDADAGPARQLDLNASGWTAPLSTSRWWSPPKMLGGQHRRRRHLHRQHLGRLSCGLRLEQSLPIQLPPGEHLVRVHLVAACHRRYRGTAHVRLLDNPPLLLEGVSLPGPRASAQSIRGNRLCAGVHLGCTWTPNATCPPRPTSFTARAAHARRPSAGAYVATT